MSWRVLEGDCRAMLATLPAESVQTCVTSPPYWGLRDYGHAGQLGLEKTPEEYVARMVEVFREVRRVLRPDGTLWLNLGDTYGADKQLSGIPWRVAFALQSDGWVLRCDVVWHKPNAMPDAADDRPTRDHESLFLFARADRYVYDADAIREPLSEVSLSQIEYYRRNGARTDARSKPLDASRGDVDGPLGKKGRGARGAAMADLAGRNRRAVWTIPVRRFSGAHFAVMPWDLVEPCVLAGSRPGDTVLDPFTGSGTVGMVARRHGRSFVGVELNPEYAEMARARITGDMPLFNTNAGEAA
jgi:DNA modification methylase